MCPMTPDPTSLFGRAPIQRCHMSCNPQRVAGLKNKKSLSCNGMQQGSCVFKIRLRITEAHARCAGRRRYHDLQIVRIDATVPCYSASTRGCPLTGAVGRGYDLTGRGYAVDRSPRGKTDKTKRAHTAKDIICYSYPLVLYYIGFYLPRDNLSVLGSHYNCTAMSYKRHW
jgi:Ni,Fe-hydrogenase I small subunit